MRFLKKFFSPDYSNDYHPHSTRYYALLIYSTVFILTNFVIFPAYGFTSGKVLASNLDPDEIINLTNMERKSRKINPLIRNSILDKAALAKGKDMLEKQYWSHYGPNGESPWQFILDNGYEYIYAGENLAKDFSSNREVVNAWMKSPTHKANILNLNFSEIGIAIVSGKLKGKETTIIVQMFGHRSMQTINTEFKEQVDQIELYKPRILSPQNNSVVNTYSIDILGESILGDSVLIYVNDKVIGEIPLNGGLFSSTIKLTENKNILQAQAKDTANSSVSLKSDTVNLIVNTVTPDISTTTVELFNTNNKYMLITRTSAEIKYVIAKINDEEILLSKDGENYFLHFNKGPEIIVLYYYNNAGNYATKEINLQNLNIQPIATLRNENSPIHFQSDNAWTFINKSFKVKDIINIFFVLSFVGLIAFDAAIMLKRGHIREWTSNHSFHLSLILFVVIGVLLL